MGEDFLDMLFKFPKTHCCDRGRQNTVDFRTLLDCVYGPYSKLGCSTIFCSKLHCICLKVLFFSHLLFAIIYPRYFDPVEIYITTTTI